MNNLLLRLASAVALSLPLLAVAQQDADATHTKAPAQPLRYQSAFGDYKPWQDIKPGNWRQLNDNVAPGPGKASGHAGHGSSAPAASAAVPNASAPAAPAHLGHEMQGGQR